MSEMKLWLLRPNGFDTDDEDLLWSPWYDKTFGFIVRAETEQEARVLAQSNAGDEKSEGTDGASAWTSPDHSTCVELAADGPTEIIMIDRRSA